MSTALMELKGVSKRYRVGTGLMGLTKQSLWAVQEVDLRLESGEVLGLVGESGCGKSTLGQLALRLIQPTQGQIFFKGQEISGFSRAQMRPLRREMQIVFQDPVTSLNPRMSVGSILAEPFIIHGIAKGKS
jgi:ABC-type microcin C transport system duplicated ATPase subunit YejF